MARHKFRKMTPQANTLHTYPSAAHLIFMTVEHQQLMPYLVKACPSFQRPMARFIRRTNTKLIHVMLGEFAKHLLKLYKNRDVSELHQVAEMIEFLYLRGTDYVKSALTGGLLEAIKIHWHIGNIDPEHFAKYLHPVSIRHWQSMNRDEDA